MQRGSKRKVRVAPGRQLEATVHTSLPPRVKGVLQAYVRVCMSAIEWEYSIGPPASKLCVGLKWWGEESSGTIFRVPVVLGQTRQRCSTEESTTLAFFPVRSALPQLKAYLKDMKALKLLVGLGHMTDESMVIGRCTLPSLSGLTEKHPYENSLPIVSPQGHRLGTLHIEVEIQVARAGQTSLTTSTAVEDTSENPVFKVGPGAPLRAKRREIQEIYTEESKLADNQSNLTGQSEQPPTQSASSHKAALLAKYIDRKTFEAGETTKQSSPPGYTRDSALPLGPQQQQVIAELIERGERLRDAMVASVLQSGLKKVGEEGERERRRSRVADGIGIVYGDVYSSEEEAGKLGDGDISMDESDYPLHDPSLLQKLLYNASVGAKVSEKVDSAVQTVSHVTSPPPPPSTTAASSTVDQKPPSSPPNPTPSSTNQPLQCEGGSCSQKGQDSGSVTDLASFFSGQSLQRALDAEILHAVGMDRLTLLGRVTSCRVLVETLVVDPEQLTSALLAAHSGKNNRPRHNPKTTNRGTFFVEYHFPAPMAARVRQKGRGGGGGRGGVARKAPSFPLPHEVVRVASKKMKDGVVCFGHRSVFPVSLVGSVTRQWWHDVLIFSIFYRPPTDRAPFLLGKARVPFRRWLMADSSSRAEAVVSSSVLKNRQNEYERRSGEKTLGKLTVSVHLLCGKGDGQELPCGDPTSAHTAGTVNCERDEEMESKESETEFGRRGKEREEDEKWRHAPPIRVKTQSISAKEIDKQPNSLQLLLMIPEGANLHLPTTTSSKSLSAADAEPLSLSETREVAPNCYLVCRLFCANPYPKTTTMWASTSPHFNFKQVFPLYLTPSLLEKVCNNFTVVEVWHKTPGTTTDDELLGLVKLSLHQFYLAFSEDTSANLCLHAQLPVVAVDSYCPVISPFSGSEQGHLAVLMAMGSAEQITVLQQQFATGAYVLHRPFSKSELLPKPSAPVDNQPQIGRPLEETSEKSGSIQYMFDVTVSGVRGLSVFNNTVWGEADCFVQYHFPSIANEQSLREEGDETESGEQGVSEVTLQPCRTDMTLCVPNPTFAHETRHTLSLPPGHLVQRVIMTACGGSGIGGVPFELWRRFYYPNIRDQLIAKASLPVAKLCALVSMQRMSGPTVQSFSLPMQLVTKNTQGGSGGVLEVTVQYQALQDNQQPLVMTGSCHKDKTHTILTVEVARATGLKDAALLAAQEQPVPLEFAAEVGANSYARVTFPDLLENEKRQTKTVMRSFSPDFSHSFDVALPLVSRESVPPYTVTVPLAQRLAECSTVVEIWHKIPKNDHSRRAQASVGGVVFGHRLAPAFRDVCLGRAVIPLVSLLERESGVSGWFPLYPPVRSSKNRDAAPELTGNSDSHRAPCYVGGVEISLTLSKDDDRQLILSHGLEMGWKLPEGSRLNCLDELREEGERENGRLASSKSRLKFCVKVTELWVPVETVTIMMSEDPAPYMYCYVRYKFFDSDVVFSVPKALSYCREGRGCYHFNHCANVTASGSHDLEWYIGEQCMAVEVWTCPNRRRERHDRDRDHHTEEEAGSESTLLGTAFIWLQDLYSEDCSSISGSYPLFKAGEVSLGNQRLVVEVEKSVVEPQEQDDSSTVLEILDDHDGSGEDTDFVPLKPVSETAEGEKRVNSGDREQEDEEEEVGEIFTDMFEARVVIHQALHLPMMTDKTQEKEWPPSAYVTLHPHPKVDKIVTEAVSGSQTPHWNHQCLTHIPNLYLDSHCPGLELQVWSRVVGSPSTPGDGDQTGDSYIGCALVDLSTLPLGLPHISGWYNVTDFSGEVQGQIKVSIVPSKGLSLSSQSSSVPLLSTVHAQLSAESMLSSHLSSLPPPSSHCWSSRVLPAPSFMEKSSSVLFRKLKEDLKELDHIQSSLKTNVPESSEPPDLNLLCNHLHVAISGTPTSPQSSIATLTSLPLDYSSSGPSLEYYAYKADTQVKRTESEVENPTKELVHEPMNEVEAGITTIERSPDKEQAAVCEMESTDGSSTLSSQTPHPQVLSDELAFPHTFIHEHSAHNDTGATSETTSLHVQVGDTLLHSASSKSSTESESDDASSHAGSLTDVSTCSSDGSPLTDHRPSINIQKPDALEDRETTDALPVLMLPASMLPTLERKDNPGRCALEQESPSTIPQTIDQPTPGNGENMTGATRGATSQAHSEGGEQVAENDSHVPTSKTSHPATELKATTEQPPQPPIHASSVCRPEVSLPNFFMPLQELERTMRSLRASVLSRPPPPSLFEAGGGGGRHSHTSTPHQQHASTTDSAHHHRLHHDTLPTDRHTAADSITQRSGSVKTFQDVDQLLKSRRAMQNRVGEDARTAGVVHDQRPTLSNEKAQRLSRIFTSQPRHTNSEN